MAFAGLFGVSTAFGLDSIVVRNLVKDPEQRDELLSSAFYMKLWAEITTVIFTITAVYFIKQGDKRTLYLVALSSIGFIFQSVYVIDSYLL
jgi:PST family polysaccharide transporter